MKEGDKVPIKYIKDEKDPFILTDTAYPDWLFSINVKRPTKLQLQTKIEKDGIQSLGPADMRRTRRLIIKDEIRRSNMEKEAEA